VRTSSHTLTPVPVTTVTCPARRNEAEQFCHHLAREAACSCWKFDDDVVNRTKFI
jgi:hypothetical protein